MFNCNTIISNRRRSKQLSSNGKSIFYYLVNCDYYQYNMKHFNVACIKAKRYACSCERMQFLLKAKYFVKMETQYFITLGG